MKQAKLLAFLWVSAQFTLCNTNAVAGDIGVGVEIPSPDRKFMVQVTDHYGLIIKDILTSGVDASIKLLPLLQPLKWTGDSKTIVAITHIAGGSNLVLIHPNNGQWKGFVPTPPMPDSDKGNFVNCGVIKIEIGIRDVKVSYRIISQKLGKDYKDNFYISSFTVNPESGDQSQLDIHEIDSGAYNNLKHDSGAEVISSWEQAGNKLPPPDKK